MTDNLPVPDDAPWLNLSQEEVQELRNKKYELSQYGKEKIRKLMTENYPDSMFEEAAKREEENALVVKVSEEDYQKVQEELERQRLAKKTFEELTKNEKIKLALEELAAIVMGGQDGEEFYNSVKFIKEVLESLKDT